MICKFVPVNFDEYLTDKKIDSASFRAAEPKQWQEWHDLFQQMSVSSFTAQKLYLINPIRRKYKLVVTTSVDHNPKVTEDPSEVPPATINAKPKPVFKPKIK